ncbi:MAG: SurA N-terminal domain-containing protein [Candidatus Promineifilaceae bacterium]
MIGFRRNILLVFLLLAALLAACDNEGESPTSQPTGQEPLPAETAPASAVTENSAAPAEESSQQAPQEPTPIPASPTPSEPLAAMVNGSPIFLSDYENELARYQQAEAELGATGANYSQIVIDTLIEQELISQAAAANGVAVTEEEVNARLTDLQQASGSPENFAAWLQTNQWTEEQFREAITAELLTQKMIETVTADVPFAAEQIHARYIRVDDPTLAQTLLDQINGGADFAELARQNSLDPSAAAGGDMGFFSAGSLLVPELEAPAFALQPGQTSQVIPATNFDGMPTYYILQVIERDPQRPFEGNQRSILLEQAVSSWIAGLREQAEITVFVDTNAQ